MKKQKNILYLALAFIPCLHVVPNFSASVATQNPVAYPNQMPSVAELFGNMSEEEIVQQIAEAQKLFESLTPDEMQEFAKIVDQTYAQMSPQDRADIEGIANLVKPYFPEENIQPDKKQTDSIPTATKKSVEDNINTNNIQSLIDNINQQIDNILLKANSNKDILEEFTTKWSSKVSFDSMKRQILTLKQDRLAQKLTKKENQEDKDLVKTLEDFYKDLKNKNSNFEVEDSFGLPSISKKQNEQLLKQAQDILFFFNTSIDIITPTLEKFLKKWDPEAIELAKEAAERNKQAQAHAKDSSVRRGSLPATPAPEPVKKSQPQKATPSQNPYAGYYDSYAPYGDYNPYTSSNTPSTASPSGSTSNSGQSAETKKKDDAKKKEDDKKKDNKKSFTNYDEAIDALDGYFDEFDSNADTRMIQFLRNELADYPSVADRTGYVANPETQQAWMYSTGKFKDKGFTNYTSKINTLLETYAQNPIKAKNAFNTIEKTIPLMTEDDLKKLNAHSGIKKAQDRLVRYQNELDKAIDSIRGRLNENTDPRKTFLSDQDLANYKSLHNQFEENLNKFKATLIDAYSASQGAQKKTKRWMRKIKGEKERSQK